MLTDKQEKFAQAVALEGMSLSDAYRAAYNTKNMKDKTVNEKACLLSKQGNITARIEELRASVVSSKIMTAQKRKEWLTEVINDPNADMRVRLQASDQLNKMEGEYVTKVDGSLNIKTKLEDLL
jgi:phage terminase small subunit